MSLQTLKNQIPEWAKALGFSATGFVRLDRSDHESHLLRWLSQNHHGSMDYMARNVDLRVDPVGLLPGSVSAITVRMDYLSISEMAKIEDTLAIPSQAYIARYALGRDYHKVIRRRLTQLATQINEAALALGITECVTRACTDSAPILEKRFAEQSGLGWIGKKHFVAQPKPRVLVFYRRVAHQSAIQHRNRVHRQPLRQLHSLLGCLSNQGVCWAL